MADQRFLNTIAAIDAANARDPFTLTFAGETRPKELLHAELLTGWIERLVSAPSEALLLAARAHHLRRWERPRSDFVEGRREYLRWRTALYAFHADAATEILAAAGYGPETTGRVAALIAKRLPRTDPEAQAIEDGICLVFLETQLDALAGRLDHEKMLDILRKTWRKMSLAGQQAAITLAPSLSEAERTLIREALGSDE